MARPEEHAAVVLTLSPTGLAVARALGARGVRVYGVDRLATEVGHFSRFVTKDRRIARLGPGEELLEGLLALGREQRERPVLYLAGDTYMEFVAKNERALREVFVLPRSMAPDGIVALMDKRSFYLRAREAGIRLPATFFPEDEAGADEASRALRFPAIVKPTQGHLFRQRLGGRKLVEVGTPGEAFDWWKRFRDWGGEAVLQEVVPGPERNIFVGGLYVDAKGACRALFTARKARQYPPMYGSGSYMESCWAPEIADLSLELVDRLRYAGICGTEYKWDPRDEKWTLIEMNPRPTLWFSLPRAAGVDVVWAAHADLTGSPLPPEIGTQRAGVRWQLLSRDLVSALHFWRRGELGVLGVVRTVLDPRGKDYGVPSLRDPATIIGAGVDLASKYFTHVRSGGTET